MGECGTFERGLRGGAPSSRDLRREVRGDGLGPIPRATRKSWNFRRGSVSRVRETRLLPDFGARALGLRACGSSSVHGRETSPSRLGLPRSRVFRAGAARVRDELHRARRCRSSYDGRAFGSAPRAFRQGAADLRRPAAPHPQGSTRGLLLPEQSAHRRGHRRRAPEPFAVRRAHARRGRHRRRPDRRGAFGHAGRSVHRRAPAAQRELRPMRPPCRAVCTFPGELSRARRPLRHPEAGLPAALRETSAHAVTPRLRDSLDERRAELRECASNLER